MRLAYRRCIHCKDVYEYQMSGWGARKYNDGDYCPRCMEVVSDALKSIKPRYACREVPIEGTPYSDVTIEDIDRWNANDAGQPSVFGARIQRIWPGLFDLKTGDEMSIKQVIATDGPHKGVAFQLSRWKISREYEIKVSMEWDIIKDQSTGDLWREYRS